MMRLFQTSLVHWAGLLALLAIPSAASGQTPFTAEDMLAVVRLSGDVAVSPTGREIAYVLPDLGDEWNVGERRQVGAVHIQRIGPGSVGEPIRIGGPGERSSFPAFSPDGSRLAFHTNGPDGGRLAVRNSRSGEVRPVGSAFSGLPNAAPQWAGDRHIVFARPRPEPTAAPAPRVQVLRSTDAVLPGDAFFANRQRSGLVVVDVSTGEERTLLADDASLRGFEVSPSGSHVLARVPTPESAEVARGEVHRTLLWSVDGGEAARMFASRGQRVTWLPDGRLVWRRLGSLVTATPDQLGPAEGGTPVPFLPDLEVPALTLAWSPDGARFASLVVDPSVADPEIEPPQADMFTIAQPFFDLYVIDAKSGSALSATSEFDHQVTTPVWSRDGNDLFFRAVDGSSYDETLYRYDVRAGRTRVVASGPESYAPVAAVPGGLLVSVQSATRPPDLFRFDAETGARTRITDLNPQLSRFDFSRPELFHFESARGEPLGALLYRPTGTSRAFPVVTYVYEKLTPSIHRFSDRHQIFATHGFGVLMPNVKVRVGETGTSFVESVVPAVEAVRETGETNGRFCLWGGSFGAYATSFVITQTDIFDCAVSRATPPELFRNWASGRDRDSDNIERGQARMGGSPFEVMERYLAQSAFFHLDQVETPVLMTHGVNDRTILFGEGEMMFYALRRLGKVATFVIYRDGDHSLYRRSRSDALDVHQRMLEWFDEYLLEGR